jgi:uncharacterized membrane protein
MSGMEPLPTTPAARPEPGSDGIAKLVYVLYLSSLVVGVTALVGVVMAYVHRGDAPEWLKTHYRYQIRTFWLGILYAAVGLLLTLAVVGIVVLGCVMVWLVVRCVKGLKQVGRGEPMPDPGTWLW